MSVDYEKEAANLLTRRFRDTNVADLVKALVGALQESDDVAESLPTALYDVDAAEGVQLESLADLVGAPFLGAEEQVRALVRTWIRKNQSQGKMIDLLEVIALFPVADFVVLERFPARLEITAFSVLVASHSTLVLVVNGTRAAAVGTGLVLSTVDKSNTFQYSTGATTTSLTAGYGFGQYAYGYEV